jgi:hypothetical protein
MQRVAKILAAMVFASGILVADAAWAFGGGHGWGGGGGWHGGGWGGGWYGGWGGLGWGYPYYYGYYGYPSDYYYGYGYPYGYPPPEEPTISPYCATRTHVCMLRQPREIGSGCSCKGSRGEVSALPPQ